MDAGRAPQVADWQRGLNFALRFRAHGTRRHVTLGGSHEGCARRSEQLAAVAAGRLSRCSTSTAAQIVPQHRRSPSGSAPKGAVQFSDSPTKRFKQLGSVGGALHAILVTNEKEMYAAIDGGAIKRSLDGGRTWQLRSQP